MFATNRNISDLILVDKPSGMTSFGVIRELRKILGVKRIGHAGTLDPLATGLLIVGVGKGTKQLTNLIKLDKSYLAEILIGESRTTDDMEGEVVESRDVVEAEAILRSKIASALKKLHGTHIFPVSAFSAIKVNGVPMYKRARAGLKTGTRPLTLPKRQMTIKQADLIDFKIENKKAIITVEFSVASGTYIRSLSQELGKIINYPTVLKNLRRTRIGNFYIEDAISLEALGIKKPII